MLWILFLGALVSNLGVIPKSADIYSGITSLTVPGSLNFFALWEGLEVGDPDLFAAANAVLPSLRGSLGCGSLAN